MKRTIFLFILLYFSGSIFAQPKYHKDYSELNNPKRTNAKAWAKVGKPLYASFVSKDVRYAKEQAPNLPDATPYWGETGWRGERLSAQLLLWSGAGASDVRIKISDLETERGEKIRAENCTVGYVRYVMSDAYGKDGCAPRRTRDFDSTLVADVIEQKPSISIKARTVQPVWLTFSIPAETPSGKYKGDITITAKGVAPITFSTNIYVRQHVLPSAAGWTFDLDLWQNPYAVARHHDVAPWSKAHLDALRPAMALLARSGQKSITAPIANGVFDDHPSMSDFKSLLSYTKRVDGSWGIDFTMLDMWVELMMGLGIDGEISCYVGGAPLQNISYFDQASNSVQSSDIQHGSKEYADYMRTTFDLLAEHLREKGWLGKTSICMRESGKERLRRVANLAAKADSSFKISYLGNYFPDIEASIAQYSVSQSLPLAARQKNARTEAGRRLSFYQPCSDAQPGTYLASPTAEAAWIGWYAAANGFGGYSRQAYNAWGRRALQDARSPRYPAGYAALAYPDGRSSIRLERLVEGIQDFEKIKILLRQFEQSGSVVQREKLQRALGAFTLENLKSRSAAELVDEARMMLNSL